MALDEVDCLIDGQIVLHLVHVDQLADLVLFHLVLVSNALDLGVQLVLSGLDVLGSCDSLQSQTDLDLLLSLRHEGSTELLHGLAHVLQVVLEAQTRLRQAEAAFGIAKKNLEDCSLYAPFSGVVGQRRISAGETALPGVPVLTLLEVGRVKVRFSVPEQEIARLGADSRIGVGVAALGDRVFPAGKIEKGAVANPAAHTYDVRATLDNAAGELLPGMVCRVTVSPAESAEEIAVPLRAVQQAGDGSRFVWTVRGDSAVRTAVTTGRLVNNGIVLTGGVAAGDRIVVDGMQKIGEGSKVVWR